VVHQNHARGRREKCFLSYRISFCLSSGVISTPSLLKPTQLLWAEFILSLGKTQGSYKPEYIAYSYQMLVWEDQNLTLEASLGFSSGETDSTSMDIALSLSLHEASEEWCHKHMLNVLLPLWRRRRHILDLQFSQKIELGLSYTFLDTILCNDHLLFISFWWYWGR
jgi:hypothetical protein